MTRVAAGPGRSPLCQAFAVLSSKNTAAHCCLRYGSKPLQLCFPLQVSACPYFLSCNRNNVPCVKALALLYHLITYKKFIAFYIPSS